MVFPTETTCSPQPPRPVAQCRQFQEDAKDASVSECTWTLSALEALRNALYKLMTYLLTYTIQINSNKNNFACIRCAHKERFETQLKQNINFLLTTLAKSAMHCSFSIAATL